MHTCAHRCPHSRTHLGVCCAFDVFEEAMPWPCQGHSQCRDGRAASLAGYCPGSPQQPCTGAAVQTLLRHTQDLASIPVGDAESGHSAEVAPLDQREVSRVSRGPQAPCACSSAGLARLLAPARGRAALAAAGPSSLSGMAPPQTLGLGLRSSLADWHPWLCCAVGWPTVPDLARETFTRHCLLGHVPLLSRHALALGLSCSPCFLPPPWVSCPLGESSS